MTRCSIRSLAGTIRGGMALALIVSVSLMASLACPSATQAQIPGLDQVEGAVAAKSGLDMVPADAWAFVMVPNPEALNRKIGNLSQALGVPAPDVMGQLMSRMGMPQGVDQSRAMLLVVPGADMAMVDDLDELNIKPLMVVPTSDYDALVKGYNGDPGQPLAKLNVPNNRDGYAKRVGDYAVIGPSIPALQDYQLSDVAAANLAQVLGPVNVAKVTQADFAAVINLKAVDLGEMIGRIVKKARAELDDEQMDPQQRRIAQQMLDKEDQYRDLATQGAALMITANIADRGVAMDFVIQLNPGAELAGQLQSAGQASSLMNQLPDLPYLFAMSMDLTGSDVNSLLNTVLDLVPEATARQNPMIQSFVDGKYQALMGIEQAAMMYAAPGEQQINNMMAQGLNSLLQAVAVMKVQDADAYRAQFKQYYESLNGMTQQLGAMGALGQPAQPGQPGQGQQNQGQDPVIEIQSSYITEAMSVAGVAVDQYSMQMIIPPDLMQQMGPAAMLMSLGNQNGYVAEVDGMILLTSSTDLALLRQAIEAAKQRTRFGQGGVVQQVRDAALHDSAAIEQYINIQALAQTAGLLMAGFGMQPLDVPENLPPVAGSAVTQANGWHARLFVPTDVMRFVSNAAMTVQQRMQQGPAGQPGQAGPPNQGQQQGPAPAPR